MTGRLEAVCARLGLNAAVLSSCTDLTADTAEVSPGACFIAVRGARFDGHDFLDEALSRGARAILCDRDRTPARLRPGVACLRVPDTRILERELAAAFFGDPSRSLRVAGLTGTNGKTTSSILIGAIERALGHRTAVVNTLGVEVDGARGQFVRALPPPATLQRFLRDRKDDGHAGVVLECSSWSLHMDRTIGVAFDRALVTRLTRDHLDVHPDMHAYARAKWRLVDQLAESGRSRILSLAADFPAPAPIPAGLSCLRYSVTDPAADLTARILETTPAGSVLEVLFRGRPTGRLRTNLPGVHNIENLLGVLGLYPDLLERQANGQSTVLSSDDLFMNIHVDGRLEPVAHPGGVFVYVDYAHTPDALEVVLKTLINLHGNRICTVFGCGGDRDPEKRPLMGAIAAGLSREVIVTSDNPRSEDPEAIIAQILAGTSGATGNVHAEPDRRRAIALALTRVGPKDVLLVAGKGHETEQILRDRTIHFCDRTVLQEEISRC